MFHQASAQWQVLTVCHSRESEKNSFECQRWLILLSDDTSLQGGTPSTVSLCSRNTDAFASMLHKT